MVVMDYRTQGGLADYGFSIEYLHDIGWRVYIIFQPFHQGHDDILRLPYQSIDDNGRRYVAWPAKLDNLGDAKTVAALWAELAQRYVRAQVQHADYVDLIERYQRAQEQKQSITSNLDYFDDGTIIQQMRFGRNDVAVLDISPEASTINWTTNVAPRRFVSEVSRITDLDGTDPVFLQISPSRMYGTTVSSLHRLVCDEAFDVACELVRIDLSPTRSVAWQTLRREGDSLLTVAGMGEQTEKVADADSMTFLEKFLSATSTLNIDRRGVTRSLARLTEKNKQEMDNLLSA
jgi:hypothetical protein